ncbi:hypothetical protein [Hydrogenophaga sp.]|uniref:hypothetical protein n=1 Tax=Hydrogenophaga sp. TaxID=1904254 RepID=UPI002715642A|nr:hypothetical protein [Hydrogenophaga sp.]MDO9437494.1 hypothetical protein [Hydrogenophaga sp.]
MGKIFTTNTWRAPLQLIDCWLPAPSMRNAAAANEPLVTRAVQRFARAGWLGRGTSAATATPGATPSHQTTSCRVRVLRQPEPASPRQAGVRLVISGRINDVCAELDRLADQESRRAARAA